MVAGWHKLEPLRRLGEGKRDLQEYRHPLSRIQRHLEVLVELISKACRRFGG